MLALQAYAGFCQQQTTSAALQPLVLGHVRDVYSRELGETRVLNIYLPPGYDENDTTRYPVVYLLDGSVDEDFIHIVGLYQFNSFSWVGRVPPSIVVGIANVDRKRDFTFPSAIPEEQQQYPTTGHSAAFIAFLEKELQPFVAKNYRTTSAKTLIGESLGGLLATEILLEKPGLFHRYIIISPSLWWDGGSLLNQSFRLLAAKGPPTEIYIGVGKEGLTPGKVPRVMEVDANVLADKLAQLNPKNLRVVFDYLPAENHAAIGHQAVLNALKLFSGK